MKKLIPEIITPAEGQTESWCHIAPFGEYTYRKPTKEDPAAQGKQLLDLQALNNLVKVFKDVGAIILVDREHLSIVGDDTTAMGWIEDLEVRGDGSKLEDGLYAMIRWTDIGLANIRNRRLRWLSPVWDLDKENRPEALDSAGLTNTARFREKLKPVVNKNDNLKPQGKDKPVMDWTKLLAALGLPADATPEQAAAKVAELQEQIKVANKAAEDAKLTAEGEKVASENEEKIANKEAFVKAYVLNKESAMACLGAMKAPEKKDTVVNKADAKTPSFMADGSSNKVLNKLEQFKAMPEGSAKTKFQADNASELLDLSRQAKD